ncbi:DNA-binding transcriptional MerR regulator [Catenuloplanes nepalensis]|uniref:DNA-binding transcriptional MerR regulator n=1 Tax=Catenuloplanes nepalensis TaxID=587533 RepID=A0ABT9MWJ5_9ACTN|nr:MerR family transcriptional regulator [Catenuloplanes nepalensis]MDP9795824.1 DNA-binding transcriptional MerR regulator [Catenuloplanes nepalensis]
MLIGEVARRSGVSARMLRHYDTLGLVRPTGRTVGNYREYTPEDIRRIFHVEGLRSLGLSLRQIARTLDDPGFTPSALVGDLIRQTEERLRRDRELLDRLRTVGAAEPADWQDVARVVELLHGLGSRSAERRQQAVLATPLPADLLAGAVFTESDPIVAGALQWALARAGGDGAAHLSSGLTSDDADVRRRTVLALAKLPGDDATALLTGALDDPEPAIRQYAALALGPRGVTAAVPTLLRMVVNGPNDVEAGEHLGTLAQDPAWAGRILRALTGELAAHAADTAVRIRLVQALAEMPGMIALDVLRTLALDDDRPVALIASTLVTALEERAAAGSEPPAAGDSSR